MSKILRDFPMFSDLAAWSFDLSLLDTRYSLSAIRNLCLLVTFSETKPSVEKLHTFFSIIEIYTQYFYVHFGKSLPYK